MSQGVGRGQMCSSKPLMSWSVGCVATNASFSAGSVSSSSLSTSPNGVPASSRRRARWPRRRTLPGAFTSQLLSRIQCRISPSQKTVSRVLKVPLAGIQARQVLINAMSQQLNRSSVATNGYFLNIFLPINRRMPWCWRYILPTIFCSSRLRGVAR